MRHIPEEELHAYLDQALSRLQDIEIEVHLAECPGCQDHRDHIAALRDRTTAVLAIVSPPQVLTPAFESIRHRYLQRVQVRRTALNLGAWAASITLAMALGWKSNEWLRHPAGATPIQGSAPTATVVSVPATLAEAAQPSPFPRQQRMTKTLFPKVRQVVEQKAPSQAPIVAPEEGTPGTVARLATSTPEQLSLEVSSLTSDPASGDLALHGLWRTVPLNQDEEDSNGALPLVTGLPVVQVQQQGAANEEVTAVDQRLASGEVIRTIEGPAAQVSDLISHGVSSGSETTAVMSMARREATLTLQNGGRMVAVTGPSSVLQSLMTRVQVRRWPR
jgi:anti-sigma factor RsiW